MINQNSILDKIIESQEKQQAASFNPNELISILLKNLSNKESDILSRRFGLAGKKKETLEQIGQFYNITRERIRQIETATIKKLKDLKEFKREIETAEQHVNHLLENHGGVMEEITLLDQINLSSINDELNRQASQFILSNLLNEKIEKIKPDSDLLSGWKLPIVSLDLVKDIVNELVNIIENENQLLEKKQIMNKFQNGNFYQDKKNQIMTLRLGINDELNSDEIEKLINSHLKISKKIDENIIGELGLSKWNTITPKRMSDKVYLVLRKNKKPLHFTEITDLINQSSFDKKIAYPATIHNELILDERYVLVGRGIYALKEWGYQPGTVLDIILDILKKSEIPMTKDEIIDAVMEQRIVRKSTIYLALTNKEKIKKLPDGKYTIADNTQF